MGVSTAESMAMRCFIPRQKRVLSSMPASFGRFLPPIECSLTSHPSPLTPNKTMISKENVIIDNDDM